MSRTIDAHGDSLEAALRTSLAALVDCDADKVELDLSAPGIDEVEGEVALHLRIGAPTETDDQPVEAPAAATETAVDEPDRDEAEDEEAEDEVVTGDADTEADADTEVDADTDSDTESDEITIEDLDAEADAAADFLEGLLDALDLPGDLSIKVHADHAEVELVDLGSGALIGRRGQTLEAIQELVRCSLQRQFQRRSRVKIDAEGYRARRLEKLLEKAEAAIEDVLDTGEPQRLEPMDVFERKAVHHLVAEQDGVMSRSQGREPARRVIIEPE